MIGIEIRGSKELESYLKDLKNHKFDKFKLVGAIGVADIQKHFRNSQGPSGKWQALKYRSGKPLQKTGALQQSISEAIHGDNTVELGTNLIYARMQNYGLPKRNVPARTYMWLSDDVDKKISKVLVESWEKL